MFFDIFIYPIAGNGAPLFPPSSLQVSRQDHKAKKCFISLIGLRRSDLNGMFIFTNLQSQIHHAFHSKGQFPVLNCPNNVVIYPLILLIHILLRHNIVVVLQNNI